jgi:amino acid adenylation domain-containing protein
VLVEQHLVHRLPADPERTVVLAEIDPLADPPADDPGDWPEHDPAVAVTSRNLAYVMYTSGSTGRPKGVLIEHQGAVNFLWWMRERFELRPDQAALQWTAYSFDAAVWELFWPLVVGARAVVAPAKLHLDLDRFVDLIADNEVATLHFVPAMLQTFLSAPRVERCTSLRHVFVSGEPVPVSLMQRFQERLDADLINLYGVTEVSIDSTYYVCPRGDDLPFVRSGTPLHNTQTYVLDESLQPVPFGARGEVFIAGDSVTRGYLRRPNLTAYRFVPDPFRGGAARMYRTGDIAQLLPDGNLRFLGRSDHQVKIRGIRIELLEVAAELNALPSVRESLVVPFGEGADRGLVAYVIAEEGETVDVAKLRAAAADRMPPYMVPNAIIVLDRFPLNSNGKVDRPALPDPAQEFSGREAGRAPSGPVEERIAEIWCRLLGLRTVGADEEFFSIGGNSLLATQVIAEVRRAFEVRLSLREWLEANTIAELAAAIVRRSERDAVAHQVLDEVELHVA